MKGRLQVQDIVRKLWRYSRECRSGDTIFVPSASLEPTDFLKSELIHWSAPQIFVTIIQRHLHIAWLCLSVGHIIVVPQDCIYLCILKAAI